MSANAHQHVSQHARVTMPSMPCRWYDRPNAIICGQFQHTSSSFAIECDHLCFGHRKLGLQCAEAVAIPPWTPDRLGPGGAAGSTNRRWQHCWCALSRTHLDPHATPLHVFPLNTLSLTTSHRHVPGKRRQLYDWQTAVLPALAARFDAAPLLKYYITPLTPPIHMTHIQAATLH
jgi:hypothetical protein